MQEQSWDLKEGNLKSLVRLKSWTSMICQQISSYIDAEGKQVSSVVDKVRQYMLAHLDEEFRDRKSTRLNSSHVKISYAVFCLKKKTNSKRLHDNKYTRD